MRIDHLYGLLSLWAVAFQLGLALGMPWGALAMGGLHPGSFPPALRGAALISALVLAGLALLVRRVGQGRTARRRLWPLAAFLVLGLAMNLATPSAPERALWAPIIAVMLTCVICLARRP